MQSLTSIYPHTDAEVYILPEEICLPLEHLSGSVGLAGSGDDLRVQG